MLTSVIVSHFARQLKAHCKKYRSLKEDLVDFLEHFDVRQHQSLGGGLYKARMRVRSISRGKSASFRVIILLFERRGTLVPITLYFKGNQEDISQKEINNHLEIVLFELRMRNIFEKQL